MKIKYEAKDGQVFFDEASCLAYEAKLDKEQDEAMATLNRLCKFFDIDGNRFSLDDKKNPEANIYGVVIKNCTDEERDTILYVFGQLFDDLYQALFDSDFDCNNEVVLVYDWTSNRGWTELDWEKQDYHKFITKVLEGA